MSRLLKSSLIVSFFMFFNIILMFVFEMLLARRFGTNVEMDCYLAAITFPELIVAVIMGGFNFALIPSLVAQLESDNPNEAYRLMNTWLNLIFIIFLGLAVFVGFTAKPIVSLFFPGFSAPQITLTAKILLLYFPVMIFKSLTSLLNSIYFARNRFLLAPALPVAGAVLSVGFFLSMQSALGVFAIPLSLALNTLLQFSVLFGVYVNENHYKFNIFLRHELFKKHLKLMIPLLIGGLITKSVFLVDRNIASTLGTGAISALGYATKVMNVMLLVGIGGLSLASFPLVSSIIAKKDWLRLRQLNYRMLSSIFFMTVFIYILIFSFGEQFLKLVFQYGSFTAQDSQNVADVLRYLGGFFVFGALGTFLANLFYAVPDTKTPTIIGVIGFLIGVVLKIVLSSVLSYKGIALASTLYYGLNVIIMFIFLKRQAIPFIEYKPLLREYGRILVVAAVSIIIGYIFNMFSGNLVVFFVKIILTVGVFIGMSFLFKLDVVYFLPWSRLFNRRQNGLSTHV